MRRFKILASVVAVCLGFAIGITPLVAPVAQAVEPYSYTITLFAGDGEFSNGATQKSTQVKNGDPIEISYTDVTPNDDRYYAKGIRLAGHDNSEYVAGFTTAKGDAQYVVAYGLKKNQVAYTLNFVDANGDQIAESETLYGNPGDKPVVAFRYIDGFLPRAYNLTGTLSENVAENVFTFTYDAAPGVTYQVVQVPGAVGAGAVAAAPDAVADVVDAAAAGEIIGEDGNPLATPEEVVDIDEDDNPLAASNGGSESLLENPAAIVGIIAGIAILAAIIIALVRRNRKNAQDQSAA